MSSHRSPSLALPAPVARFFAHQSTDAQAVARCFAEDAVVHDEGHQHRGRAAIAAWNADAVRKYRLTAEPLSSDTTGSGTTVAAKVSGTFPGSPIQLRFRFAVEADLISRLEITP